MASQRGHCPRGQPQQLPQPTGAMPPAEGSVSFHPCSGSSPQAVVSDGTAPEDHGRHRRLTATAAELRTEHWMGSRFRPVRVLGSGSFGQAILVIDTHAGRANSSDASGDDQATPPTYVVVKRLFGRPQPAVLRAALNEAAALAALRHPNIVAFHAAWIDADGHLHLSMEYCDGGDLAAHLARSFPLTEVTLRLMLVQLLRGVEHMHSRRVIHRDLKLQNVFICDGGTTLKIGDFGLAKLIETTDDAGKTQAGTPYYFSPEIARGVPHTTKTDIWSLGVMLFTLLTKKLPFVGRDIGGLIHAILHQDVPHPWTVSPPNVNGTQHRSPTRGPHAVVGPLSAKALYTAELCELAVTMMTKDPERRPTALELLSCGWLRKANGASSNGSGAAVSPPAVCMELVWRGVFLNVRKTPSLAADVVVQLRCGARVSIVGARRVQNTARAHVIAVVREGKTSDSAVGPTLPSRPASPTTALSTSRVSPPPRSASPYQPYPAPPPSAILWYELASPVSGFCAAMLPDGRALFRFASPTPDLGTCAPGEGVRAGATATGVPQGGDTPTMTATATGGGTAPKTQTQTQTPPTTIVALATGRSHGSGNNGGKPAAAGRVSPTPQLSARRSPPRPSQLHQQQHKQQQQQTVVTSSPIRRPRSPIAKPTPDAHGAVGRLPPATARVPAAMEERQQKQQQLVQPVAATRPRSPLNTPHLNRSPIRPATGTVLRPAPSPLRRVAEAATAKKVV